MESKKTQSSANPSENTTLSSTALVSTIQAAQQAQTLSKHAKRRLKKRMEREKAADVVQARQEKEDVEMEVEG